MSECKNNLLSTTVGNGIFGKERLIKNNIMTGDLNQSPPFLVLRSYHKYENMSKVLHLGVV